MTDFTPLETPAKDVNSLPVMHPGRPVGRDGILKDIYNHLQSRQAVLLHGESGIGKSTLAAALASAFVNQPGGVLWLTTGTHPLSSLLVQVARGLNLSEVSTSEQPTSRVGSVAAALTQQKPFIILDNVTDALAAQQFIDKCAGNLPMLILSDNDLEGSWEKVHVDALADMEAVVLFKQKAGISDGSHDIDIYGITKLLEYKPYPIVMAARGMVAAKQKPADFFKNLKQLQSQANDTTTATIALSYRALNNALQGLILMLGATFKGEGSLDFIATVSGVPEDGIKQAMNILAQLYLVEKFTLYSKDYYRLHPLVYEFAQAALQGKNQLAALQKKVHDATLTYARNNSDAHQNLAKEMANFLAAAQLSAENGDRETANQLVAALTDADGFVQRGYVYELLQLRNTASGSTSAFPAYGPEPVVETAEDDEFYSYDDDDIDDSAKIDDSDLPDFTEEVEDDFPMEEDSTLYTPVSLDDLDVEEGMSSTALRSDALPGIDVDHLRQALAQAKQQGDAPRQLQILKAIGKVQVGQGKETEAIATYNELLEAYEEQNDPEGTLDTLNMLAALLTKTGNSQAAVMHATRGIQAADEQNESATKLLLLTTLGDARQDLGETQAAVDSFNQALEIARQTGDKQNEAISLYKLGYSYLDNGDTDDAIHNLEQARSLFKEQNKRDYEGRVLGGLGSANAELERWTESIGYYQSALHIAREVKDKEDEMLQLENLGQAQVQAGKLPEALMSYRQALHIAYTRGKREEIVSGAVELTRLMLRSNRLLDICKLLIDDALTREPDDRDVTELAAEINEKKAAAIAQGIQQAPVAGTAQEYAANAYSVLDQ